jgi:hypothetical protein
MKILYLAIALSMLLNIELRTQVNSLPAGFDYVYSKKSLSKTTQKIEAVPLVATNPVKIMVLLIAIPGHPAYNNSWPVIANPGDYPDENFPLLGTLPNGQLLREYVNENNAGPVPVEFWYKAQIEQYYKLNSNGKFQVEVIFPKTPEGNVYQTTANYDDWKKLNNELTDGMVSKYNNWRKMAAEVMEKVYADNNNAFKDVKLMNFVYLVHKSEYSVDSYSAFSYDIPFEFTSGNTEIYNGHVITTYTLKVLLHESLHRIGSLADDPGGFEGLPDRTTLEYYDAPRNMTWGYDVMYNKGFFPSENALYGAPPMLTIDRMFFEWIEQDEVLEVNKQNILGIKLRDVNKSLTVEDKANKFYRAVKVMIRENFRDEFDEYFLLEFRNGTDFDRNFYNIYETEPHTGILIWHVKENTNLINRNRQDDHFIDLEVAVPYNGWHGNPIPDDNFPRNYQRPYSWRGEVNAAGDYDYYDDNSSELPLPDGGVHRWELTDDSHPEWTPFYVRRNTLRSNFFSDMPIRGVVTNTFMNTTRPSSKDWRGNPTFITIKNMKRINDYMTIDVEYILGVSSADNSNDILSYKLEANYPNPFNPETVIKYTIPSEVHVELVVTNVLGQIVTVLYDDMHPAGNYSVIFSAKGGDGSDLPSGIYLYSIKTKDYRETRKMVLLR